MRSILKVPRRLLNTSSINMGRDNILKHLKEKGEVNGDSELEIPQSSPPLSTSVFANNKSSNFPFTLSKESTIQDYLNNNKYFVDSIKHNYDTKIFDINKQGQSPHTLWIGCSDSRASEGCLATLPGEIFVHRNIANIVNANDISCQGVIQYAIDVLKVKKVIICGHTDCGGVWASLSSKKIGGVLDLWLNPIRHIRAANLKYLHEFNHDPHLRARKLVELNIISSVTALKRHPSASMALKNGDIEVWGMLYDVGTGYLQEVEVPNDEFEDLFHIHDEV
ncbi:uncharacterized protein PRCAT00003094001 [Priceomyces carsonii]|uniref:uncharacterized protein n=1 Tax=Priceomyces carsonii TaxID=28549 RepID=UPI002EDA9DE9|nr:unnamed protein product [Priceomyces carsonii]